MSTVNVVAKLGARTFYSLAIKDSCKNMQYYYRDIDIRRNGDYNFIYTFSLISTSEQLILIFSKYTVLLRILSYCYIKACGHLEVEEN